MTGFESKRDAAAGKLQEPEQQPVATVTSESGNPNVTMSWWHEPALPVGTKLYTAPPQREWVGLTDDEIDYQAKKDDHGAYFALGALWAGAKLKEKNT